MTELIDFDVEGDEHWITLKLKNGVIIKVKTEITAIIAMGNDPNTGLPVYAVQAQNVIRMVKVPSELLTAKSGVYK
jgi:hypothetical protein